MWISTDLGGTPRLFVGFCTGADYSDLKLQISERDEKCDAAWISFLFQISKFQISNLRSQKNKIRSAGRFLFQISNFKSQISDLRKTKAPKPSPCPASPCCSPACAALSA